MSALNRRSFLATASAGAALLPQALGAQSAPRDWSGRNPARYPDPDIIVLDKRFAKYKIGNTPLQRMFTGCLWAEGPAWNGVGKYLVWSDIPNDVQLRRIDDDGHASVMRRPTGNSTRNTLDRQ